MRGFFKSERIIRRSIKSKAGSFYGCDKCGLYNNCITPKMKPTGKGEKRILIIGEGPGKREDEKGIQFVGPSGQLLRDILSHFGINLERDCIKTNAIICRKPNDDTPSNKEISCCRSNVFKTITEFKPKKIITLGKSALSSLVSHRTSLKTISRWVGWQIPDQEIGCWIFPTYHPAFILRDKDNKASSKLFEEHLKCAIGWRKRFPNYGNESDKIKILIEEKKICNYLSGIIIRKPVITFDYETTGIKPHRKGHQIVCMSIAENANSAVSFPFLNDSENFKTLSKKLLIDRKIRKTGHNIPFESSWTTHMLGIPVEGWYWDSMLAAHILDNRTGITGLKFQAYIKYGILGYDKDVKSYLDVEDKEYGANSFNKVLQLYKKDPMKLLTYCGLDSMFEHRLYLNQTSDVFGNFGEAYNLFHEGTQAFSDIQENGIRIDTDYYEKQKLHLERRIARTREKILKSEEAIEWKKIKKEGINPKSDEQLKKLFYNILEYTPTKMTKPTKNFPEGNPSVDQDVLKKMNTSFADNILLFRKLNGLNDKISDFLRETVDGIVHPSFGLNVARSYRSEAHDPNFQNIHNRDKESQKLIRRGIIARKGRSILDVDYKGIEVCMSACNHKDPEMIEYLEDKSKDMHRDQIMEILFLKENQVTKTLRYFGKNGFVFPEFYGDYYVDCAKSIWDSIQKESTADGVPVLEHLKKFGIRNYTQFEDHMKEVEYNFWYQKFNVYRQWKEDIWKQYQRDGYIDLLTGFRCKNLMKKNDITNYPNQGPGFHCLLWSLIQINKRAKKEKWNTKIIGQIHDQLVFDYDPKELNYIIPIIRKIMCEDIRQHWEWIIVPLEVEIETTEIDGNWYEKREIGKEIL